MEEGGEEARGAAAEAVVAHISVNPEQVKSFFIAAARGEVEVGPCFWFDVVAAMGKLAKEELKTSIPRCAVCEAVRRIVLDAVDPSRHNWISLDKPANIILQYAKRHRCQHTETDRRLVVQHARIVSAYIREWVRVLADGVNGLAEHQSVSQSVLHSYLSRISCCR